MAEKGVVIKPCTEVIAVTFFIASYFLNEIKISDMKKCRNTDPIIEKTQSYFEVSEILLMKGKF